MQNKIIRAVYIEDETEEREFLGNGLGVWDCIITLLLKEPLQNSVWLRNRHISGLSLCVGITP